MAHCSVNMPESLGELDRINVQLHPREAETVWER